MVDFLFRLNEDLFFSTKLKNIATVEIAEKFASETDMNEKIEAGHIPYALHAYEKYLKCDILELSSKIKTP